jgi:MFS family permease
MNDSFQSPAAAASPHSGGLRPIAVVMATGIFATTFVQLQGLGALPLNSLLMKQMNLDSNQAGTFVAFSTLPWTFKAVAGLLVDGVPIFGSRRRSYLLLSAVFAAVMWGLMAMASASYSLLFLCAIGMNTALVFGSTTAGGLLVEGGQRFNASGKLSSLRAFAQNLGAALGVPVGGFLAGRAFGWTSAAAILPVACMFVTAWFFLRDEPRLPPLASRGEPLTRRFWRVISSIGRQLGNVLVPQMAVPALLLLFIQAVPTFRSTSFYEYQTKTLGYSDATLGMLSLAGYGAALFSAAAYAWVCRKVPLRISLYAAILLTSLSALPYLIYPYWDGGRYLPLLLGIEGVGTFLMCLAYVPLFDLAVRATPKGSEALGYSVLISVWNVGLMIGGKSGPWLYQKGVERALAAVGGTADTAVQYTIRHQEINQLIWLNAIVTLAGLVIVWFLPKALVGRPETTRQPVADGAA